MFAYTPCFGSYVALEGTEAPEVMRHTNPFTSRKWKRDLTQVFIQAAVVDLLTAGDFPLEIDDRGVAENIRTAFSNFVSGQTLNQLNTTAPKHEAEFYLRIWWALDSNRTGSLGHLLQTELGYH